MKDHQEQARIGAFEQLCEERGIPCTLQRRVIFEAVLDPDDHPTADQVYQDINVLHRVISRATVHRTLETLVSLGVITKASHSGKIIRYDARLQPHQHLVCMQCDRIIDFQDDQLDALQLPNTSNFGFETVDFQVQLRGICRSCREKER